MNALARLLLSLVLIAGGMLLGIAITRGIPAGSAAPVDPGVASGATPPCSSSRAPTA